MRISALALAGFVLGWVVHPATWAEDGIAIQSVRIEGTILKADDPILKSVGPIAKDEFILVAKKDKVQFVIRVDFGGDKKLAEQAEKLAEHRVVVECKGEFKVTLGKVTVPARQGTYEQDVVSSVIKYTAVKIELAK